MPRPERIRAADVARLTSLGVRAVQGMAARGKIPGAAKLGKVWTFDPERVRAWIRAGEADAWPSDRREDATGAGPFCGGLSPSTAASIAARYEQLIRQKPGAATKRGEIR